jgi:hypothetical protein
MGAMARRQVARRFLSVFLREFTAECARGIFSPTLALHRAAGSRSAPCDADRSVISSSPYCAMSSWPKWASLAGLCGPSGASSR